jgi:hypothetical protein
MPAELVEQHFAQVAKNILRNSRRSLAQLVAAVRSSIMPATPLPNYVTLNEAVTLVAFGHARTPSEEMALRRPYHDRLLQLIDLCQAEATSDSSYRHFPKRLPSLPLSALIGLLEETRSHWPPSACALHATAVELDRQSVTFLEQYESGLHRVLGQVAEGRRKMFGRIAPHPASPVVLVPPPYCLGAVTIGHTWRDIGPTGSIESRPKAGSILHTRQGLLPILRDAVLERRGLVPLDVSPRSETVHNTKLLNELEKW